MLSLFTTAATTLSLGILASAQTWGSTFAIQGVVNDTRPWVYATGSLSDVGIDYSISKAGLDTTFYKWFIQSAPNATNPSTQVWILNSFGGFAEPYGGNSLVCGGQGMLLQTVFTPVPTVWDLTPLGNNQYKLSTNASAPNTGDKPSPLFWSVHRSTGLLPLDPEGRTTCTDSGGIAQVFQFLPPEALTQ